MSRNTLLETRCRARIAQALVIARAHEFVCELEPPPRPEESPAPALRAVLSGWRRAVRAEDDEKALDAAEQSWARLSNWQDRVAARDALIQAYRVRWACENAPLRPHAVECMTRYYRTAPVTTASQSKYEYFLTRLFAGPLSPERTVPETQQLREAVEQRETVWGAAPVRAADSEVEVAIPALKAFAEEARGLTDVAFVCGSGFLQRFGTFKSSLGRNLFDPRLSAAVVEANVSVFNSLNHLLAEVRPTGRRSGETRRPSEQDAAAAAPARRQTDTGEVDLSAFAFIRRKKPDRDAAADAGAVGSEDDEDDPFLPDDASATAPPKTAQTKETAGPAAAPEPEAADSAEEPAEEGDESEAGAQQPSARAHELIGTPENRTLIESYLRRPRSPEVWQLDLDVFLSPLSPDSSGADLASERRKALELILTSDDLICARLEQGGAPSAAHRAEVKRVSAAMALLQVALRRAAEGRLGAPGVVERILYASDHVLWERLRLEASLKRRPRRFKANLKPRAAVSIEDAARRAAFRRRRNILGLATAATILIGLASGTLGVVLPARPVDRNVRVMPIEELPGSAFIEDARAYRNVLYVTVGASWSLIGVDRQRAHVRALADYAAPLGFSTISVVDLAGEPRASFRDGEAVISSELTDADLEAR